METKVICYHFVHPQCIFHQMLFELTFKTIIMELGINYVHDFPYSLGRHYSASTIQALLTSNLF